MITELRVMGEQIMLVKSECYQCRTFYMSFQIIEPVLICHCRGTWPVQKSHLRKNAVDHLGVSRALWAHVTTLWEF